MGWLNPPPVITQLRTQLMQCASLTTAPFNLAQSAYHYPYAAPVQAADGTAPDAMPFIVLAEQSSEHTRWAEGATGLITGTLLATIYADTVSCPDAGTLETLGRQIPIDLGAQYFGLTFRSITVGVASVPQPGARAAGNDTTQAEYHTILLTLTYGLTRSLK